jgi:hypothetical protein
MPRSPAGRPDDARAYRARLDRDLALGALAIVLVVGGGLIWLIWGTPALVGALVAFGATLVVVLALIAILKLIEWAVRPRD